MKGGRSKSLDTLKLQQLHAQQQPKNNDAKQSYLNLQENLQQKLLKQGALQTLNHFNNAFSGNHISISSSKKDFNGDPQEIKLFVQQHNQNFNKLMSEKLDLEEEIKYLKGQNEQLLKYQQLLSVSKSKQNMERTHTPSGQTSYKEYSNIKVDLMNYSIRNKELENELFQLQQQMRMYKMQLTNESPKKFLSNTDYDPHQFSNKISDLGKIIADQKSEIQSLQMKVKEKERQIEVLSDNAKQMQTRINLLEKEKFVLETSYQSDIQRVKDSQAMELESLRKLNKQLDESIIKAQNSYNESEQNKQDQLKSNNKLIIELQEELKNITKQKNQLEQQLSSQLMDLKGEKDLQLIHFNSKIKELENSVNQWEIKFFKQKVAQEQEIDQLKELQEQRILLMKKEIESKENQQLKKQENFQQSLRDAEKDKNNKSEIIKQLRIELEDIKAKFKLSKDSYEIQIEDLRQEIKRFGQSKMEMMDQLEEKERENKKLFNQIQSCKAEIESLKSNIEEMNNQVVELQKQNSEESFSHILDQRMMYLEKEFQRRQKESEDERILELKAQRDKFIGEIIQLEIKHKHELQKLQDRLDVYQMKDAQSMKSLDQRIQDIRDDYESQIEHMVKQNQSELNQTKQDYEKQIEGKKKKQIQKEEKMKQDFESALQTQKIDYELNYLKPLKKEYNDLQKASKEKINALESSLQIIKHEMEGQVNFQKNLLENSKKTFEMKLSSEKNIIGELEEKVELLKKEIEEKKNVISELQDQIKQLNALINIIKCEKSEQCSFLEDEISKIHQSHTSKENELILKFEQDQKSQNKENLMFVLKMKQQFEDLLLIEQQKYEKVLMEYEELLKLYDAKGCREEDAILIQALKDECFKTQEELKYLILEVVNREKMYNKIFTNYQETEFMQILLKKAERIEQFKNMIHSNQIIQLESEQSQLDMPLNSEELLLPNLNISTRNNKDFLPMVNTSKSFKGFKNEETPSTSANSGALKLTSKIVNRGFDLSGNGNQTKNIADIPIAANLKRQSISAQQNSVLNQSQIITKQMQPHYMITQLNQTNSVFKGNIDFNKTLQNSSSSNNQRPKYEQLSTLDNIQTSQYVRSKLNSTKNQFNKQNSTVLGSDSNIGDFSSSKRKVTNREKRCFSQMSDYQDDSMQKQSDKQHTQYNIQPEEPLLVLNAQSVNIQKNPQGPFLTHGNQRRKYLQNKNNKVQMHKTVTNSFQVPHQQRFSTGNISINNQINLQQELLPAFQNSEEDQLDRYEKMQLKMLNHKSVEISNHQNESQLNNNVNMSMSSQQNSGSVPAESRKTSYAQIYAQMFMNKVSRIVKTSDGSQNARKKII
ncbi:hypothetical protein ABPG72_013490 [Tetrahymena utriculariae]